MSSLFLFQPSNAPGREGGPPPGPAPAPAPGAAGEGQAAPQGPPPDGGLFGGGGMMFLPLLLLVGYMIWSSRNQQKKQKELEAGLKVGERVLTTSGIVGKITEVGERTIRLEVAPGVHVTFIKTAIQGTDPTSVKKDEKQDAKKDDAKDKDAKAKDEPKKDK